MIRTYYVYIVSNYLRTVLYIGVTTNIVRRIGEHKRGEGGVFTSRYKCFYLMYYEEFTDVRNAIAREKQLKRWHRTWKLILIKENNPDMGNLSAIGFK